MEVTVNPWIDHLKVFFSFKHITIDIKPLSHMYVYIYIYIHTNQRAKQPDEDVHNLQPINCRGHTHIIYVHVCVYTWIVREANL